MNDIIVSARQWSAMRPLVIQSVNLCERGVSDLFRVESESGNFAYFFRV